MLSIFLTVFLVAGAWAAENAKCFPQCVTKSIGEQNGFSHLSDSIIPAGQKNGLLNLRVCNDNAPPIGATVKVCDNDVTPTLTLFNNYYDVDRAEIVRNGWLLGQATVHTTVYCPNGAGNSALEVGNAPRGQGGNAARGQGGNAGQSWQVMKEVDGAHHQRPQRPQGANAAAQARPIILAAVNN